MGDVYHEEFQHYMKLAKQLIKKLPDARDRNIFKKWIKKLCGLESEDITVKKNRNAFFKYMLHVLQDGRLEGPFTALELENGTPAVKRWCPCVGEPEEQEQQTEDSPPFMCYWSPDKTTYIAMKPLGGCGALIYMAISNNVHLGWDVP